MERSGRRGRLNGLDGAVYAGILVGCLALIPARHLAAQAASTPAEETVARLSLLDGEARVTTAGYDTESVDAAMNMPLAMGSTLRTGSNADAEVEFRDGSVLRESASSSATLIRLQPQTEIGLDDGLYYLELRAGTESQFVVYAGDLSITPKENASFRVRVQNGEPEIAVLRGTVSVTRADTYSVDVQHGESLRSDPKDNRRYLLADSIGTETGDAWNERRAQQVADAAATETIARENFSSGQGYGWSDLDSSGAWYPLPGEGLVWQPYGVDASFDPYGYGNWVYGGFGAGAGYVWASGYPWGWLPYHCGSWGFFSGFGWGWQPAAGCGSYGWGGVGWASGGYPVRHPPHGWRGPLPPRAPATGGIVTRHPTLPIAPPNGAVRLVAGERVAQPIQFKGTTLHPLAPIAPPPTPHGTSAVGSALRRDYPVQNGTHRPLLGLEREGPAVLPGGAPDWHALPANQVRVERSRAFSTPGGTAAGPQPGVAAPVAGSALVGPNAATPNQPLVNGWHNRIVIAQPVPSRPAGAGSVPFQPNGVRAVPGQPTAAPAPSPVPRGPVVAPAIRPVPVVPAAPARSVAPQPAPAPHFNPPPQPAPHYSPPPPSAPAVHMSAPSAPAPSRSK